MSQSESTQKAGKPPGVHTVRLLGLGVLGLVAVHVVLLASLGSLAGQHFDDPRLGAALVLAGVVVAALGVPVVAGIAGARRLIARGARVQTVRVVAGVLGVWSALGVGLVATLSPVSLPTLVVERGTFVVDGLRGVGPYGPAAVPVVQRLLAEGHAVEHLSDAGPLLASETAAAEALQLLLRIDATRDRRPEDSAGHRALDRMIGKWSLDLDAIRADPSHAAVIDGRALLSDALALPAAAGFAESWSWLRPLPEADAPTVRSRTVIGLGDLWEARYEDGAWRLFAGDPADLIRTVAPLEAVQGEVAPDPVADGVDPAVAVAVRAALEAAARGRYGWMAGTTAWFAGWPEALTGDAAARQGERVRAWCAQSAGDDALFQHDQQRLFSRFGLGAPTSALTNAQLVQLAPRGREWLTEILAVCRPWVAARQEADARLGNPISDARRSRWAERDAAELVKAGRVTSGPGDGLLRVTLPGGDGFVEAAASDIVRGAVLEGGAWRIDWAD